MIKSSFKARKSLAAIAVGTALMLTMPSAMAADNTNGTLKGIITSDAGTQVSGATITVKHQTKGISRTVTSNSEGKYNLRGLPIGRYTVTITKDGFGTIEQKDMVISLGQSAIYEPVLGDTSVERIQVTGSSVRMIDTSTSTSGITFSDEQLSKMPVANGFESISMLAPGVVSSGGTFDASSMGGGSGAENGYFLNGMNISELRSGIGSMDLPWEAIAETQVKTGAISAEFGRFIGGVVNAVAKSGTNEFKVGGEVKYNPDALRSQHDSVYKADGSFENNTLQNSSDFTEGNLWASGAIVEDELFFYALYNPRNSQYDNAYNTSFRNGETTGDRWLVNMDYYISDDHSLNFLAFSNQEDWENDWFAYDRETNTIGERTGPTSGEAGGEAFSLRYDGYITDDFSVSAMAAQITQTASTIPSNLFPSVRDDRTGNNTPYGNSSTSTITDEEYVRTQFRLDLNYELENHSIQFGVDIENLTVGYIERPNGIDDGAGWWTIKQTDSEGDANLGIPADTTYIERRVRTSAGDSEVNQFALYLQDSWQVTDELVLNLGVRYNQFENTTTQGLAYSDLTDQIAPRLQAIYDLNGDGSTKLFATYGRYFQPIPANMNIKQASGQRDVDTYYATDAVDGTGLPTLLADGSPSRGNELAEYVTQEGIVDNDAIADNNLEPMYSDEFTFGFETEVFESMSWGSRFVYRELKESIEDGALYDARREAIARWEEDTGKTAENWPGAWVLLNPGRDVTIKYDMDGDGVKDELTMLAEDIGLPQAERTYLALENTISGNVTDELYINASYTWTHSYGNTEGLIRTDNGQADPGWTMSGDYPETTDHGKGNLPNDRRHAFKISGTYDITESLVLGFVSTAVEGRPYNSFGRHPEDVDSCLTTSCYTQAWWNTSYANNNFYTDGEPVPRGTAGKLDWMFNIDMSLAYNIELAGGDLSLKATVYNLLDSDTATDVDEFAEQATFGETLANPNYLNATERKTARYVALEARYEF